MEEVVRLLEAALLPELAAFGESLSRAVPCITTETFSHRHAQALHSLGLSCYPTGTDVLDQRCVALIVNVIDLQGLSVKGYVAWQVPSLRTEAETAVYQNPTGQELTTFCHRVRDLFEPLQAAARRGRPPRS